MLLVSRCRSSTLVMSHAYNILCFAHLVGSELESPESDVQHALLLVILAVQLLQGLTFQVPRLGIVPHQSGQFIDGYPQVTVPTHTQGRLSLRGTMRERGWYRNNSQGGGGVASCFLLRVVVLREGGGGGGIVEEISHATILVFV